MASSDTERVAGGFRQISSRRISRQVVAQFQEMMRDGSIQHGDRLPPERDLADRFEVSRNSVREALRELDLLGLVESRHGEGTFVRLPSATQLMAPFRAIIELSNPAVDSVMEFRIAFEPGVAAVAATNLTAESKTDLANSLDVFERAVESGTPAETVDADFHFAVARATGNPTIVAVHAAVYELLRGMRSGLSPSRYHPHDKAVAGHRLLHDAIVARDPGRAARAMHDHLVDVADDLTIDPPLDRRTD